MARQRSGGGGVRRRLGVNDALARHAGLGAPVSADFDKLRAQLAAESDRAGKVPRALNTLQLARKVETTLAQRQRRAQDEPNSVEAQYELATALLEAGRMDEAAAAYRRALALGADPERTNYKLAAIGRAPVPEATPASFVAAIFDSYADTFETELVGKLKYQIPEVIREMIDASVAPAPRSLRILDIGCGTGLAGERLHDLARRLEGVDLSAKMLAQADAKRIYDDLKQGDLRHALKSRKAACDLIVAADVLIYIGDFTPIFASAYAALRHGGHFAYSVERNEDGRDIVLQTNGRYRHGRAYLEREAAHAGFVLVDARETFVRFETGAAVPGLVHLLRRD